MRKKSWPLAVMLGLIVCTPLMAAEELRLWPGKAPGSEDWSEPEEIITSASGSRSIINVSDPTMTVHLPDASKANGTAVLVIPGSGMRMLSINDGEKSARWLNDHGIAAFVLKHRVLPRSSPSWPIPRPPAPAPGKTLPPEIEIRNANTDPTPDDKDLAMVLRLATADAQRALQLIRANAKKWRIEPTKVGIMGFSAGGGIAISAALAPPGDAYPDFLISVYGPALQEVTVPPHAPPLFMAVGQMHWNVTNGLVALFAKWKEAEKPAELHIYDMINGRVGIDPRGNPGDMWLDALLAWMQVRDLVPRDGAAWVKR
jgi:hypothetical protein